VVAGPAERYRHVRDLRNSSAAWHQSAQLPVWWRATLSAMEVVFALMSAGALHQRAIRPFEALVERTYQATRPHRRRCACRPACRSGWRRRSFRHYPGAPDCSQPPPDVAVLSISCGASLVRWLGASLTSQRSDVATLRRAASRFRTCTSVRHAPCRRSA
jgi:hypothetical protein